MAESFDSDWLQVHVRGKKDDEIYAAVEAAGGAAVVLDLVFEGMKDVFEPAATRGESAVTEYRIDVPEGTRDYQVKVAEGVCEIFHGAPEKPRVILSMSLPNFLRLASGQLNGMQAFMSGQLKITGDVMFSQMIQTWFPVPAHKR